MVHTPAVEDIRAELRILVVVVAATLIVGGIDVIADGLRLPYWLQVALVIVCLSATLPALIRWVRQR